jgi:hypothetical protein
MSLDYSFKRKKIRGQDKIYKKKFPKSRLRSVSPTQINNQKLANTFLFPSIENDSAAFLKALGRMVLQS